jgi:hypothetical protein
VPVSRAVTCVYEANCRFNITAHDETTFDVLVTRVVGPKGQGLGDGERARERPA